MILRTRPEGTVPSGFSSSMQMALHLARRGLGRTSPNPAVGAVIMRDGEIVGQGSTQPAGSWHAEIMALRQAGEKALGATLYCTLEPCCHFGRTPPCTESIIAAGIAEVHVATLDPNPLIGGKGKQRLEEAGIRVVVGDDQEEARRLIEAFAKHITTGLPFVIAKWAMTLDGKIATRTGDSKWITGEAARERVHQWRDTVDAILVGVDTVIADDPLLTARPSSLHGRAPRPSSKPLRVVADSRCRIPPSASLLGPELAPGTLIATTELADTARREQIERTGAQVAVLPTTDGRLDLKALMQYLGRREATSVLVEGGGKLLGSLFAVAAVDKVAAFVAPKVIGGNDCRTPVAGQGVDLVAKAWHLRDARVEHLGEDVLIEGYT